MPPRPGRVLIVDDEVDFLKILREHLEDHGYAVVTASGGAEALARAQESQFDAALLDVKMPDMNGIDLLERLRTSQPDMEAIILTGHGTIEDAVRTIRLGAYNYLTKPVKLSELDVMLQKACEIRELRREVSHWREGEQRKDGYPEILGESPSIQRVLRAVEQVAPTDTSVLVEGESGTGKELIARAIHRKGKRSGRPFVVANCGTFQAALLDSELFGHEKGAFTGAHADRQGLFELAHGGTLFVDEVTEMDPACQTRFLRVLETGEFRRVGGARVLTADVRVIAATNKVLSEEVKAGKFREDLFYRLHVFRIAAPPLRDRAGDLPLLVRHFLSWTSDLGAPPKVNPEAYEKLLRHRWPGNVRELAHTIERAKLTCRDGVIRVDDLALPPPRVSCPRVQSAFATLAEIERAHVASILEATQFNKRKAARILGISLRNLYRKIEQFNLSPTPPVTHP